MRLVMLVIVASVSAWGDILLRDGEEVSVLYREEGTVYQRRCRATELNDCKKNGAVIDQISAENYLANLLQFYGVSDYSREKMAAATSRLEKLERWKTEEITSGTRSRIEYEEKEIRERLKLVLRAESRMWELGPETQRELEWEIHREEYQFWLLPLKKVTWDQGRFTFPYGVLEIRRWEQPNEWGRAPQTGHSLDFEPSEKFKLYERENRFCGRGLEMRVSYIFETRGRLVEQKSSWFSATSGPREFNHLVGIRIVCEIPPELYSEIIK